MAAGAAGRKGKWPIHGWIGLILVILFWFLNWTLPGLRTHWGFFPLWLGYCLTVDALVFRRKGHSLLPRSLCRPLSLLGPGLVVFRVGQSPDAKLVLPRRGSLYGYSIRVAFHP